MEPMNHWIGPGESTRARRALFAQLLDDGNAIEAHAFQGCHRRRLAGYLHIDRRCGNLGAERVGEWTLGWFTVSDMAQERREY